MTTDNTFQLSLDKDTLGSKLSSNNKSLPDNLDTYKEELDQLKMQLDLYARKGKELAREIQTHKNRKLIKLLALLRPHRRTKKELPKELYPLYDHSIQSYPGLSLYQLNESIDLSSEPKQITYQLKLPTKAINQILLSFAIDFFPNSGFIRLELLTNNGNLIAWTSKSLTKVFPDALTSFDLNYGSDTLDYKNFPSNEVILKISTDNCDVPVRIREWQRLDILKRKIIKLPFIAFASTENK